MRAFVMEETAVRPFMNRLLKDDLFDAFEVRSVDILSLTKVEISGELCGASPRAFALWAGVRPLVTAVVKAHTMPRSMKVIFSASADVTEGLHPNASALFINMIYENGALTFTTATAKKEFSLDKTLDEAWDARVNNFFADHGLKVSNKS